MNLDQAKKTIRDLLNLSEDDGAAALEAENALVFARRLMLRHNLTESDCPAEQAKSPHERAADVEYGASDMYTAGSNLSTWERSLYHAIADLVGTVRWYFQGDVVRCTSYGTVDYGPKGETQRATRITYYGPAADCAAAADLASTWAVTIAALVRMKFGGCFRGDGRCYAEGFAEALRHKVWKMGREELAQTALAVRGARQLMRVKRELASTWLKDEGIKLSAGRGGGGGATHHNSEAYAAGKTDGKRADFSRATPKSLG